MIFFYLRLVTILFNISIYLYLFKIDKVISKFIGLKLVFKLICYLYIGLNNIYWHLFKLGIYV